MHPEKSSLSIRLTEPVVSLRSTPECTSHHHDGEMLPPAVVRGLLILQLAKPTKVSSIELELQAKAITHYARGPGPSRTDVTEQYKVHSASTMVFMAAPTAQVRQRATSAWPRVQFLDAHAGSAAQHDARFSRLGGGHWQAPSDPHPTIRSASLDPGSLRVRRQLSSDGLGIDDGSVSQQHQISIDPPPPYPSQARRRTFLSVDVPTRAAGRSQSVASSSGIAGLQSSPVLLRNRSPDIPYGSPAPSDYSIRDLTLSRTSSIEELPEDGDGSLNTCATHPDSVACYGLSRIATDSPGRSSEQDYRGRSHSQFSLRRIVHVVDAVKDRVRSRSRSEEQEQRGRSLAKGKGKAQVGAHDVMRVLPRIGAAEASVADGANDRSGDGWVMFPEGTYTYPIFFTIPNNSSPTMKADHGSLTWNVNAEVKRPSTFKSKITAQKEVIVVRVLKDTELEEVEGIDLQREWEDQLQYRIQIAGRDFPVGGKVPFQLTISPLAKIKVHSISVYLDERTEYYTRSQSRARSDSIRRATLLVVRHGSLMDRYTEPILPLTSEDPDALRKSPLYRFLNPGEDEREVASSFRESGPWTIRCELRVPDSCSVLHPSNQTKGSNVMVDHTITITLRVEKEEEPGTAGKKKLYDIVIRIPIQILSCRCTSEWMFLPRYDEALGSEGDSPEDMPTCPCHTRPQAKARRHPHAAGTLPTLQERMVSLPTTSSSPSRTLGIFLPDSPARHAYLYEQLMSGSVSERGETSPSYERFGAVYE